MSSYKLFLFVINTRTLENDYIRFEAKLTIIISTKIKRSLTVEGIFGDIAMTATVEKLDCTTGFALMGSFESSQDCCNFSPNSFSSLNKTTGYLKKF